MLDAVDATLRAQPDDVDRWSLGVVAARLRLGAGDTAGAQQSLETLRRRVENIDAPALVADVMLASAQAALASDRLDEAARWLAAGKAHLPADDWIAGSLSHAVEAVLAWRRGDAAALEGLRPLLAQARERGDVLFALGLLSLARPGAEDAETTALRIRSGLRGDGLRWMLGSAGQAQQR
jgi:hypothetical protein